MSTTSLELCILISVIFISGFPWRTHKTSNMKKLLLTALLVPFFTSSFSQVCEGDVVLTTQAEVNAFDCEMVMGTLLITGPDITSLEPLGELKKVDEHFILQGLSSLQSLAGLENLMDVTCSFEIKDSDALSDLRGLDKLDSVGRNFTIVDSENITTLDGLLSLSSVMDIRISNNPSLNDCCILRDYETIATGIVDISNNAAGCSIDELNFCGQEERVCVGDIRIVGKDDMDRFNCNIVDGDLFIDADEFPNFTTEKLVMLKEVTGDFTVYDWRNKDVYGLNNLRKVGGNFVIAISDFTLDSLESIESLHGLESRLATVRGTLPNISGTLEKAWLETGSFVERSDWMGDVDHIRELRIHAGGFDPEATLNLLRNGSSLYFFGANSLEGVQHVDSLDYLELENSQTLASLEPLSGLQYVNELSVRDMTLPDDYCAIYPLLTKRDEFDSFLWENNNVSLDQVLTECGGEEIVCEGYYEIMTQEDVDNFYCTTLDGAITIYNFDSKNLENLSRLETVTQYFAYEGLEDTTVFKNLKHVGGVLRVLTPPEFELGLFRSLESAGQLVGQYTLLKGNLPVFKDTLNYLALVESGFDDSVEHLNLTAIDSINVVGLVSNMGPALEKLSVGGYLRLNLISPPDNQPPLELTSLTGKEHIGTFLIEFAQLKSLDGLEDLNKVDIMDIYGLTTEENCCGLYNLLTSGTITEYFRFDNNTCTVEEIVAGCAPPEEFAKMNVYPNPVASNSIEIEWEGNPEINTTIQIIDNYGREVTRNTITGSIGRQHLELEISDLEQGHYLIRIITGDEVRLRRLVRN